MENLQSKRKPEQAEEKKQTKAIVRMLTKRGLLPDMEVSNEARRAALQKRQQKSFHNTLLLLKNYRSIAWLAECFPDAIAEELDRPFETVDELLDGIEIESTFGDRKLEKRLEGIEKTRLMLDRINEALTVLKQKPENGQLLYDVIYLTYVIPERLPGQELLYRLNISSRQYYRLRDKAINLLSLRLWSSPDSTLDLWIELLSIDGIGK